MMDMKSLAPPREAMAAPVGRYRWVICGLLFLATAINYVDRQMIGLLKPSLQGELGWTDTSYADIVFWFQAAYTAGYILFGAFVDRIGARIGYATAFLIWTIAHMLHGAASSVASFAAVRFLLGIGESGNFPAGLKAVAEWFPPKERALATGIFNAGTNIGAIATPLIIPAIVLSIGWRAAFVVTGAFSLLWLIAWFVFYRPGTHATTAEQTAEDGSARLSWSTLLRLRQTWAFALAKMLTDPIWWLFLFWLPDFLSRRHGLDLKSYGPPLIMIYLLSDIGSVAGGFLSSKLMARGFSANSARKTTMLVAALAVTPIMFAQYVDSLWAAVAIIGVAAAAHQAWSANLFTLPSDMFPRAAVGSVIGIGGAAGGIGGMMIAKYTGHVLDTIGSYTPVFIIAGSVYLLALAIIHLLAPRLASVGERI